MTLLAAGILDIIPIIDIVIIGIALLALLFGLWRGMYKLVYGLVAGLLTIIIAIALVSPVSGAIVEYTTLDEYLVEKIAPSIKTKVPYSDTELFYDPEHPESEELVFERDGELYPFSELLASTPLSAFSGTIQKIAASRIKAGARDSFLQIVVSYIVSLIISAGAFIILMIVVRIIIAIIFYFIKKLVTGTYAGHFIDKLLGGVLGTAFAAFLILFFLAVVSLLGNYPFITPLDEAINSSVVTKMLYEKNFLLTFISDKVDLQSVIDKVMNVVPS